MHLFSLSLSFTDSGGIDIDHIEIRADNEGTTANRSFNYRVISFHSLYDTYH